MTGRACLRRPAAPVREVLPRAGAGAGSRSGLGIGLAVVRGLVEAMGGVVSARPSALGGLAVDLALPRATLPDVPTEGLP